MKWFLPIILIVIPRFVAGSPSVFGNTTRIVAAPENPLVLVAVVPPFIWVTLDGGKQWHITGRLTTDRQTTGRQTAQRGAADDLLQGESLPKGQTQWPQSDLVSSFEAPSVSSEDDGPMEDELVSEHKQLIIAVSNQGNVAFWHPRDTRLQFCPITGRCVSAGEFRQVRDVVIDNGERIWIALSGSVRILNGFRQIANYALADVKQLLIRKKSGNVVVLAANGLFEFVAAAVPPVKIADVHRVRSVAANEAKLLILTRSDMLIVSRNGPSKTQCQLKPDVQQILATKGGVWLRRNSVWFYGPRSKEQPQGCGWQMLQAIYWVRDVSVDSDDNAWVATARGPQRWHRPHRDEGLKLSRCHHPPEIRRMLRPALPLRTRSAVESVLPLLKIKGSYIREHSDGTTASGALFQKKSGLLFVGIFLEWHKKQSAVDRILLNEADAQRHLIKQQQIQGVYQDAWRRYSEFCQDAATTDDPLKQAIGQLEMEKWQMWSHDTP